MFCHTQFLNSNANKMNTILWKMSEKTRSYDITEIDALRLYNNEEGDAHIKWCVPWAFQFPSIARIICS